MASAWNAWPTPPLSRSPSKYCPMAPLATSPVDRSGVLSARFATTPPPDRDLPILPPEILRRIVRAALALAPSIPDPIPLEFPPRSALPSTVPSALPSPGLPSISSPSSFPFHPSHPQYTNVINAIDDNDRQLPVEWDAFAGRAARRQLERRVALRADVARTARSMIGVCRAWKALVTKYLYTEPVVTADNIAALARAVVNGDRKWSDINLHPHSYPGRWLTVLDLSNLGGGSYLGADPLTISGALGALLDLTPALTHLRLPPAGCGVRLTDLRHAACIRRLRALEGVHLAGRKAEDDAISLLRVTRSLELLGLVWVASALEPDEELELEDLPGPPSLAALHTLTIVAGEAGPLLAALTRAELPRLTRLVMSPYDEGLKMWEDDALRGGPRALQLAHGRKIRSLTYVATPGWPHRDTLPTDDTLTLHPSLAHVHLALPHAVLHDAPDLARTFADPFHPLTVVTLPRWPRVSRPDASTSPSAHHAVPGGQGDWPPGNPFLATLLSRRSRIRTVRIDGFTWVSPSLGRWAAESGDSGMMRRWAVAMARKGVELRDMDGGVPPVIERGRQRSFEGAGISAIRRSIDQGRRPSFARRGSDSDGG
ncbi:hypothetical protein CC85DRAFT_286083 [Cutaneotrichosporon oleaginosum]|uniref:Uncharacterized protein n=1 Tax=Cutaneotrichosporon oleaginosum TaxID=879819 RepID=A0A0J0XL84_9TREE|nr:uncharacterized protein CC85DRAFT_286083 [Cutaneotrichosporon oleaginosum]KLT41845.1 hypothetical protein CC85DRAFT_286083 [Cutaneotrichosporon oleaginosum]TXT14765.1 hypothetical protein COLE_00958 [Cutaneotrichosporon oleaginosum]